VGANSARASPCLRGNGSDRRASGGATGAAYVAAPDAAGEGERAAIAERALDVHVDG